MVSVRIFLDHSRLLYNVGKILLQKMRRPRYQPSAMRWTVDLTSYHRNTVDHQVGMHFADIVGLLLLQASNLLQASPPCARGSQAIPQHHRESIAPTRLGNAGKQGPGGNTRMKQGVSSSAHSAVIPSNTNMTGHAMKSRSI